MEEPWCSAAGLPGADAASRWHSNDKTPADLREYLIQTAYSHEDASAREALLALSECARPSVPISYSRSRHLLQPLDVELEIAQLAPVGPVSAHRSTHSGPHTSMVTIAGADAHAVQLVAEVLGDVLWGHGTEFHAAGGFGVWLQAMGSSPATCTAAPLALAAIATASAPALYPPPAAPALLTALASRLATSPPSMRQEQISGRCPSDTATGAPPRRAEGAISSPPQTAPRGCSSPIPIVRGSWSSKDIDLASRDLDLVKDASEGRTATLGTLSAATFASERMGDTPTHALFDGALLNTSPSPSASESRRASHAPLVGGKTPTETSRSLPLPSLASGLAAAQFGRHCSELQPPPAPRFRPSPPLSWPPNLALPPASPASTSFSSSPPSSSGFSMMASSPPESRFVQVGFHVLGLEPHEIVAEAEQRRKAAPSWADWRGDRLHHPSIHVRARSR